MNGFSYYCRRCWVAGVADDVPMVCWFCGFSDRTGPWGPDMPHWSHAHRHHVPVSSSGGENPAGETGTFLVERLTL